MESTDRTVCEICRFPLKQSPKKGDCFKERHQQMWKRQKNGFAETERQNGGRSFGHISRELI